MTCFADSPVDAEDRGSNLLVAREVTYSLFDLQKETLVRSRISEDPIYSTYNDLYPQHSPRTGDGT